MPHVRIMLFAGLWAGVAAAAPMVLLAPAVGSPKTVTLSGRVLKHAPSEGSSTLSKNVRLLTSSNWEGASVEVRFAGRAMTVKSGHDGNFEATFAAEEGKAFEPGLQTAEAQVREADVAGATVDVVAPEAPFFVVSDLDDTLAVTNVTDKKKLVESAFFKDGTTQPVVEGMAELYACLKADKPARPAFALVSGTPIQYLGRVKTFLAKHGFPVFGLYLRDLGPKTLSGYKQPVIRALLGSISNKAVLIGDSGEADPEVYSELRAAFPDRVLAVYIRAAGRAEDPKRFPDMVLFTKPEEAARDAVKRGLASKECVDRAFAVPADAGVKVDAGVKQEGKK